MTLKARLQDDMKNAMRAREQGRLGTIRLILAEIKQREVDGRTTLSDPEVVAVLEKMAKQRRDAIAQFQQGGRADLVSKEEAELGLIKGYLPEPLSAAELEELIAQAMADTGASSPRDMGKVMAILKERAQGRIPMAEASQRVKARLSA